MPDPSPVWCEVAGPTDGLAQGDLLTGVVLLLPRYAVGADYEKGARDVLIDPYVLTAVILTQTCDIPKVKWVLLCPVKPYADLKAKGEPLNDQRAQVQVDQGTHPAFYRIYARASGGPDLGELVVDFRGQGSISKPWLENHARKLGPRLRLKFPYATDLAHKFGNFFSRTVLPDPDPP